MMKILFLNGPNLNLLGKREPEIYGTKTLMDVYDELKNKFDRVEFLQYQSNHEGDLIDRLHLQDFDACVFNPGAFAHTSIALMDAISGIQKPVVEIHISDIHAREKFRHHSYLTDVCEKMISGEGTHGYHLGVEYLIKRLGPHAQ